MWKRPKNGSPKAGFPQKLNKKLSKMPHAVAAEEDVDGRI
jgi:hypothetical protein